MESIAAKTQQTTRNVHIYGCNLIAVLKENKRTSELFEF